MDVEKQRDDELNRLSRKMRVVLNRLEDLIDAPNDADAKERVAERLGASQDKDLETEYTRALGDAEREFAETCHAFYGLATAKRCFSRPVQPVCVTGHLPSSDPRLYMDFFEKAVSEDHMRLNPWHIGDLLFRMTVAKFREAGTSPSAHLKQRILDLLYPRTVDKVYRGLNQGPRRRGLSERRPTEYEDETRKRFWIVALEPDDVKRFFRRMMAEHMAAKDAGTVVHREQYVRQCAVLGDSMYLIGKLDPARNDECRRIYEACFTRFLLDENVETRYAAALLLDRQRCRIGFRSIAAHAGKRKRQLVDIMRIAERAQARAREKPPADDGNR